MGTIRERLMFILVFVILAGCGNSSDELGANNQSLSNNTAQSTDANLSNKGIENDTTENSSVVAEKNNNNQANSTDTVTNNENKKGETSNSVKEEAPSTTETEGTLKEVYLKKLNTTKKEVEEVEAADSSTYALKKVENDRWNTWDELLNEIYGVLKEQLPLEEMDQLREEQRKWIKNRDASALEASVKYKGGTQEHLEYVAVLANLTEERCYELVVNYMK